MAHRKKSSPTKWIAGIVLLTAAALAGVAYAKRPKKDALDFKTAAVSRGDIVEAVTANGQLSPVKNVQVGSQISGIIKEVNVDFNSRVTEGEIIAKIDPATYEQNVTLADAELANAKASLELAQLNHRRASELLKNELISASEADNTLAALHQAQAVVKMREAALQRAKVDLARTTIYAPINGVVISRNVEVGQTVAASFNTPTLFQIANDLAKMQIEAMVSEADVGGVLEGQKVTFLVDAFPTRQFTGFVKQVRFAPTTNQNVVTYTTVVEVNNADLKLRPGMTANASIITAQRTNTLKIPNATLRFRPPDDALPKSTNTTKPKPAATNLAAINTNRPSGERARPGFAGGPESAGADERRRRFENMSPEERAAARERFRQRTAEGGPRPNFGEGAPLGRGGFGVPDSLARTQSEGPVTRTIYILAKETNSNSKEPKLQPVTVKTGITDGAFTEVIDGLNDGDQVVTGLNLPVAATTAASAPPGRSPFGGPFGGGFRPR